jgi:polyphosphate glucokinase
MLAIMHEERVTALGDDPVVPSPATRLTGRALGIDIGGTGIKAAVVDVATGRLVSDRIRLPTPHPMRPPAVIDTVANVVGQLEASGVLTAGMPGGACFPSVIRDGRALTATHGERSWIGVSIKDLLGQRLGRPITVINDADAAGVAEVAYGAGKGQRGVVLLLDLGTGIGTALFVNGELVPNLQLGHLELHGRDAETRVSPVARLQRKISWKTWAVEFNELLARYQDYLWPHQIILGGGTAKDFPKFAQYLKTSAPLVVAGLGTAAGIIGAARVAANAATATPGAPAGTRRPGRPARRA